MSDHLSRGFVVPVWLKINPSRPSSPWAAVWLHVDRGRYCPVECPEVTPRLYPRDDVRPRDPNRTGGSDRPDLHPEPEG